MAKSSLIHIARRYEGLLVALVFLASSFPATSLSATPNSLPPLRQELWVPNGPVNAAILSGNTLYIGGNFTRLGQPTGGWIGLRPDTGTRRSELPRVAGSVSVILSDGSGGWYLGGEFVAVGNTARRNLAHIRSDGTLDPNWNVDTNGRVNDMASNGNFLYIGGEFTAAAGQSRSYLAAVNLTTGSLASWAPPVWSSGSASVNALEASGNTIYVGGYFSQAGGEDRDNLVALDTSSGNALPTWDPAPDSSVSALVLYGNKLYVGGGFHNIGGQPRDYLAAVDTSNGNATSWNPAVGGGSMFPGISVLQQDSDLLYIGGQFSQIGGAARNCLAALDLTDETITGWDPSIAYNITNPRVSALAVNGNTVYAGGSFTQVGSQIRNYLAAMESSSGAVTDWNPDVNDYVSVLAATEDTVYVGGGFTAMGGVARNQLAALDIATGEPTNWAPVVRGTVETMALSDSTLYIGGQFSEVGGQERNNAAAVDTNSGAVLGWNPDANNDVNVLVTDGSVVYAGGAFSKIGGQDRINLAALDPANGTATTWVADTNGPSVYDLIIDANTFLIVAGNFTTLSGQPRNNLGSVNITSGTATSWNPNVELTSDPDSVYVRDILLHYGLIYLGGYFDRVSGTTRNNLAAVNANTGAALPWNPDVNGYVGDYSAPSVSSLLVDGDTVFVGGYFSRVAGQERHNLAALNSAGDLLDWDPGALSQVNILTGDGGTIYAGGVFLAAANHPQAYIASITAVSVQTDPATNVSETSATLNGNVTAYADPATAVAFEWGTTSGGPYPNELAASPSPVGSTNPVAVNAVLPSPSTDETYYYRLRATTSGGTLVYGDVRSFRLSKDVYLPIIIR